MASGGLVDSLPRRDSSARHLAYNNTLDRTRIELPPSGDPGASGVVQLDLTNWDGALPTILRDRTGNELRIIHDGVVTLDQEYYKMLEGTLYSVSHIAPTFASASSHIYLIDMDSTYNLGVIARVKSVGEFHVELYEGATVMGIGERLGANNFNRTAASGVIATKFYYNAWVDPSGDKIFEAISSDDESGFSTEASAAWVLAANRQYYTIAVTNRSGSNAASSLELICTEAYSSSSSSSSRSSSSSSRSSSSSSSSSSA